MDIKEDGLIKGDIGKHCITVRSLEPFIACCPHEAPSSFSTWVPVLGSFPVRSCSRPMPARRRAWIPAIAKIAMKRAWVSHFYFDDR